jgi:hypothetical protein
MNVILNPRFLRVKDLNRRVLPSVVPSFLFT